MLNRKPIIYNNLFVICTYSLNISCLNNLKVENNVHSSKAFFHVKNKASRCQIWYMKIKKDCYLVIIMGIEAQFLKVILFNMLFAIISNRKFLLNTNIAKKQQQKKLFYCIKNKDSLNHFLI
jgi:hypothetical protein